MGTPKSSLYVCDGKTTLQQYCKNKSYSIQELINANSNKFDVRNRQDCIVYYNYEKLPEEKQIHFRKNPNNYSQVTSLFINGIPNPDNKEEMITFNPEEDLVKDYLVLCNRGNYELAHGLVLTLPYVNNGGVRETGQYYINNAGIPKLLTNSYTAEVNRAKSVTKIAGFRSQKEAYRSAKTTTCNSYFQRIEPTGKEHLTAYLPVIPSEFSDNNSVSWNSVSLMGRSVDYQIYTGSSREVSFTLQLHQELYNDSVSTGVKNIYNLVKLIESSCYPYYDDAWAGPPQVVFKIGNHMYIKGVLTSCSVTWKLPFDLVPGSETYGLYTNCDISISVRETNGPYGALDIAGTESGGYGAYRDETVKITPIEVRLQTESTTTTATTSPTYSEDAYARRRTNQNNGGGGSRNVQETR